MVLWGCRRPSCLSSHPKTEGSCSVFRNARSLCGWGDPRDSGGHRGERRCRPPPLETPRRSAPGPPPPRPIEDASHGGEPGQALGPAAPYLGSGRSGGPERTIRGLWAVDANRLRRARTEEGGPEGAADRSRKWPGRLRRAAAQVARAAQAQSSARVGRLGLNSCGRFGRGAAARPR